MHSIFFSFERLDSASSGREGKLAPSASERAGHFVEAGAVEAKTPEEGGGATLGSVKSIIGISSASFPPPRPVSFFFAGTVFLQSISQEVFETKKTLHHMSCSTVTGFLTAERDPVVETTKTVHRHEIWTPPIRPLYQKAKEQEQDKSKAGRCGSGFPLSFDPDDARDGAILRAQNGRIQRCEYINIS
jgi:hypothetical protein